MRKYLDIHLGDQRIESRDISGREHAEAGRYFITKTLLDMGVAAVDPLGPDNPLIFSAGPFSGTNFSNANRTSVGCKSPMTGGIKEANAGGTFALALGQAEIAGFTLHGQSDDWVIMHIPKEGDVTFSSAEKYMGKGVIETGAMLHKDFGKKVSLAICGPVGEYQGLLSGIAISDAENRPVRLAARGGVGAVMGSKKVKAIVVDKGKMPPLHDRKKVMAEIKEYGKLLEEQPPIHNFQKYGTALVANLTNNLGALPVRNFSSGRIAEPGTLMETGGEHIAELNASRGGETTHACMPGCLIKCSNIYVDEDGNEMVSPLEYETIGLLGTNCGLTHPDDIARLNYIANDLGIDTIEVGATIATLMDNGEAEFGDIPFMEKVFADIREGNERGKILAQGTYVVGQHYGIKRVPVIKKQALSAYDPRVIEVTGISMMVTAQGADHTTGNVPAFECAGKSIQEIADASYDIQVNAAVADSMGLCLFGRSVTDSHLELIAKAIRDCHNIEFTGQDVLDIGHAVLKLEHEFNKQAGFTEADDELPSFFINEPLPPFNATARLHSAEVNEAIRTARDNMVRATL
jgi:aldehyde:ferredoxin oxidoreductase